MSMQNYLASYKPYQHCTASSFLHNILIYQKSLQFSCEKAKKHSKKHATEANWTSEPCISMKHPNTAL